MITYKSCKTLYIKIICMFFIVLTVVFSVSVPCGESVNADAIVYTNVLEDLCKDTSFKPTNYPVNTEDYSINVIQIAESVNGELFVYTYQPSGQGKGLQATSINISTTINEDISYKNYKLLLLNSSGVFYKYKVSAFTVKTDSVRYYAISSIYRKWIKGVDKETGNDNTITEVNYEVSKQYCFGTVNGNPYYSVVDIETIVITDKFVGFVRYPDGFKLYYGACDSHFVAFNTDRRIDRLLEADVYYTTQDYSSSWVAFVGDNETFGEKKDDYAYLTYTDKVEHSGGGLFAGTYTWDRIQSVEDFIANEDIEQTVYSGAIIDIKTATKLTESAKNELRDKKWVLRFAETNYSFWNGDSSYGSFSTIVGDVTILRLKFETDGIVYNLGVIDNKQSGGREPSNTTKTWAEVNDNGKLLFWIIIAVIALVVLIPILPYILKGLFFIIKYLAIGIYYVIASPFYFIRWVVDRKK